MIFTEGIQRRADEHNEKKIVSQKEEVEELKEELEALTSELQEMGTEDDPLHEELERLNNILEELEAEIRGLTADADKEVKKSKELIRENTEKKISKVEEETEKKQTSVEERISKVEEETEKKQTSVELRQLTVPEDDLTKLESRLETIKKLEAKKLSRREKRKLETIKKETQKKVKEGEIKIIVEKAETQADEIGALIEERDGLYKKPARTKEDYGYDVQSDAWKEKDDEIAEIQNQVSKVAFVNQEQAQMLLDEIREAKKQLWKMSGDESKKLKFIIEKLEDEHDYRRTTAEAYQRQFPEITKNPKTEEDILGSRAATIDKKMDQTQAKLEKIEDWREDREKTVSERPFLSEKMDRWMQGDSGQDIRRSTETARQSFNAEEKARQKKSLEADLQRLKAEKRALIKQWEAVQKQLKNMPDVSGDFIKELIEKAGTEYSKT